MSSARGATLLEVIIAGAITAAVISAGVAFFSRMQPAIKIARIRYETQSEARQCMDTITERLRSGRAGQYVISTPTGTVMVPNSRIDFVVNSPLTFGTTTYTKYAIYLTSGVVYGGEYRSATVGRTPRPLAHNVTSLMFASLSTDPGVVTVTLRIDAPWDEARASTRMTTIILPNQVVRMTESQ